MKRSLLLLIATVALPRPGFAQAFEGHVIDSTSARSLPKIWVQVETLTGWGAGGTWTDSLGVFRIPVTSAGPYILKFSLPDGSHVSTDAVKPLATPTDHLPEYRIPFAAAERQHMYFDFEVDQT